MNAQQLPWRIAKQLLLVLALAVVLSSSTVALHADDLTYRVIPAGLGGDNDVLAGGTITTDGTLGLLSPENILSMSVDIKLVASFIQVGMPEEVLDGSTTLNLTNASLAIDGEVLATPTGIFMVPPPQGPDPFPRDSGPILEIMINPEFVSYFFTLEGEDANVSWSSANTESSGVINFLSISSAPAGGAIISYADSGLIAQVIPEPSAMSLALLGLLIFSPKLRLALLFCHDGGGASGLSAT